MRVHVVKTVNNIKLNPDNKYTGRDRIYSVSFPPIETCRPDAPCTPLCFAYKSMLRYKGARLAWGENLMMYNNNPENFWNEVRSAIGGSHKLPYLFRFFVGGDFVRPEMIQEIADLAKEFPAVLFMAFTKRTEWLPPHNSLPMNLSILVSMWPNWTPEGPHVDEYSRCWLDDPQNYDDRIPKEGFPCGEDCVDCKVCYHVRETPTDVVLEKHTNGPGRRFMKKQAEELAARQTDLPKALPKATRPRSKTMWIQTFTDKKFPLLNTDPDLVDIRDIAHALSNQCRYTGHTRRFYSVAQHSVIVSELVSPEDAAWGLLHDSAEAYIGDLSAPAKSLHSLRGFKGLETSILLTIALHFKLKTVPDIVYPKAIKLIDKELLMREAELFFGPPPEPWIYADLTPSPVDIIPLLPVAAEELFLARYEQLFSGKKVDN